MGSKYVLTGFLIFTRLFIIINFSLSLCDLRFHLLSFPTEHQCHSPACASIIKYCTVMG